MGIMLMGLAIAATSGMFLASKRHMRMQQRQLETTQAARAAADMIVRDLRLGGACLPVTGDFISLDGTNNGTDRRDHHPHRPHPARPVLHPQSVPTGSTVSGNGARSRCRARGGFEPGMRAYIRAPGRRGRVLRRHVGDTRPPARQEHRPCRATTRRPAASTRSTSAASTSTPGRRPHGVAAAADAAGRRAAAPSRSPSASRSSTSSISCSATARPATSSTLPSSNEEWSVVDAGPAQRHGALGAARPTGQLLPAHGLGEREAAQPAAAK